MADQAITCPKCQGVMIRGFIPDATQGQTLVSTWHEGIPQRSFWTGTKGVFRDDCIAIGAFRCRACGYLEFYADDRFAAQ